MLPKPVLTCSAASQEMQAVLWPEKWVNDAAITNPFLRSGKKLKKAKTECYSGLLGFP